jgi:hypothetical protein
MFLAALSACLHPVAPAVPCDEPAAAVLRWWEQHGDGTVVRPPWVMPDEGGPSWISVGLSAELFEEVPVGSFRVYPGCRVEPARPCQAWLEDEHIAWATVAARWWEARGGAPALGYRVSFDPHDVSVWAEVAVVTAERTAAWLRVDSTCQVVSSSRRCRRCTPG